MVQWGRVCQGATTQYAGHIGSGWPWSATAYPYTLVASLKAELWSLVLFGISKEYKYCKQRNPHINRCFLQKLNLYVPHVFLTVFFCHVCKFHQPEAGLNMALRITIDLTDTRVLVGIGGVAFCIIIACIICCCCYVKKKRRTRQQSVEELADAGKTRKGMLHVNIYAITLFNSIHYDMNWTK